MITRQPRYSKEEFARRGDDLYERVVRPRVKAEDHGKFVSIDIETGEWEMDADRMAPGDRLRCRIPDAQIWTTRVGYGYTVRFGGREFAGAGVISGMVIANEGPVIPLIVRDSAGQEHVLRAIVDTGFNDWLTLPASMILSLGLTWEEETRAILADGSVTILDSYRITVIWDGQDMRMPVYESDSDPLIGMRLLHGFRLVVDVVDDGSVRIERLQ